MTRFAIFCQVRILLPLLSSFIGCIVLDADHYISTQQDVFMPLFAAIKEATGCAREYTGKLGAEDVEIGSIDTAYR